MNIIRTLPCGCHKGCCECPVANVLHTAMNAAYEQTAVLLCVTSAEYQGAMCVYEACHRAYREHFEQSQEVRI